MPEEPQAFPAALLLPGDAFDTGHHQVMGRRVAGRGFAEAMAACLRHGEQLELIAFSRGDLQQLAQLLQPRLPAGANLLLRMGLSPDQLQRSGVLHLPDPGLPRWSLLRSTCAPHAFSLTGVIHTLCSVGVLQALEQLYSAPLHSWDALICTSRAGQHVVEQAIEGVRERLSCRLGVSLPKAPGPQLPVIPLGIDPAPLCPPAPDRQSRRQWRLQARQALGLPADAYVVLFVGRLSFHSKAHPLVLYRALERLACEQRGVVLLECGHLFNAAIASAFDELAAQMTHLQVCRVGGLEPASEEQKRLCLAAADVFCSPADNLQETFGLSLLEAMAAELPVIASDWNGYRDLVEHEVTGALVPTRASFPAPGLIDPLERDYRLGLVDYDTMIGLRSLAVEVDADALWATLRHWRQQPELRSQYGLAGARRLAERFSWAVVADQYRSLWMELSARRKAEQVQAPAAPPQAGVTPYGTLFGHYPSQLEPAQLDPCDGGVVYPEATPAGWLAHSMQGEFMTRLLGSELQPLITYLETEGSITPAALQSLGVSPQRQVVVLQALRKFGVVA